jgi:hypothetical protein
VRYLTPLVALCLVWLVVTEARRCRTGGAPASPVDITLEPEQEALETPLTREVLRGIVWVERFQIGARSWE